MIHVSLSLVRLTEIAGSDYACFVQMNSGLENACLGYLNMAQN